jgi:(S)-ureidoglycine aminohydrolase
MRQQNQLLTSRTQVKHRYALIPSEGVPYSRLPEWPDALVQVLAGPALGAEFVEYHIELEAGGEGLHPADGEIEHFVFVLDGSAEFTLLPGGAAGSGGSGAATAGEAAGGGAATTAFGPGSYALVPPSVGYQLKASTTTRLLLLRKRYEPAPGVAEFAPLIGCELDVPGEMYMDDPGAALQTLIPEDFAYDMAMNIFTFQVGHSLPVTETHIMEHGLYVLDGKGVYYLDDSWMEVEKTDFIWMGPYCPQSYYATGLSPTRYIYYKNLNRDIAL